MHLTYPVCIGQTLFDLAVLEHKERSYVEKPKGDWSGYTEGSNYRYLKHKIIV